MLKYLDAHRIVPARLLLSVSAVSVLLLSVGCSLFGAKRKIQVPVLLTPIVDADKARLIQEVNRLSTIKSIRGKVDIQFEDTSFASYGVADQYRIVDGTVTLQRPGQIFLQIQFAFVDIAQMTSDGDHFRVAVLKGDDKYKRFLKGTNSARYPTLVESEAAHSQNDKQKREKETVSALSNMRPQHLTDAFMILPIETPNSLLYAQTQFFGEEQDKRQQAKKGDRIMRAYYFLDELSQPTSGDAKLQRRFWFDRVGAIRLARVQTFDEQGALITDVSYYNEKTLGSNATASLPSRIEITRPQDKYKLSISYQDSASVELDRVWPAKAFVLENKWGLPEVDLDLQYKKMTANQK